MKGPRFSRTDGAAGETRCQSCRRIATRPWHRQCPLGLRRARCKTRPIAISSSNTQRLFNMTCTPGFNSVPILVVYPYVFHKMKTLLRQCHTARFASDRNDRFASFPLANGSPVFVAAVMGKTGMSPMGSSWHGIPASSGVPHLLLLPDRRVTARRTPADSARPADKASSGTSSSSRPLLLARRPAIRSL